MRLRTVTIIAVMTTMPRGRDGKRGWAGIEEDDHHRHRGDEFTPDTWKNISEKLLGLPNIVGELGEKFAGRLRLEIGQGQVVGLVEKIGLKLLKQVERKGGASIPANPLEQGDGKKDKGQLLEQGLAERPKIGILAIYGKAYQLLIVTWVQRDEYSRRRAAGESATPKASDSVRWCQ